MEAAGHREGLKEERDGRSWGQGAPLGPPGAGWAVNIPSVRELVGG